MRPAILFFFGLFALCVAADWPKPAPAHVKVGAGGLLPPELRLPQPARESWLLPLAESEHDLIYLAGPEGVYIYRQRDELVLVGFIYIPGSEDGLAMDPSQNIYVLDATNSVVDEYARTSRGFKLVQTFVDAYNATAIALGPDGTLYVADTSNDGGVLEYAPRGGAPVLEIFPPFNYLSAGLAVDADNDLFVSYQYQDSGARRRERTQVSNGSSHRHSVCNKGPLGQVNEYQPHSATGRCIRSDSSTGIPTGLTFDSNGNLLVSNLYRNDISILSPPDWNLSSTIHTGKHGSEYLAFASPDRLYYTDDKQRLIERRYPQGALVRAWWIPQPYAGGLALAPRTR